MLEERKGKIPEQNIASGTVYSGFKTIPIQVLSPKKIEPESSEDGSKLYEEENKIVKCYK